MKAFWREEELTEAEAKLLQLTLDAHAASAMRDNISSVVLAQAASGSNDFTKAVTAALATLGGRHAPLAESLAILDTPLDLIDRRIELGKRIPGWGNSFVKGKPDALWEPVAQQLAEIAPELVLHIAAITLALDNRIHPNPSIYTAAVGKALKLPTALLPWLFIAGRLSVWAMIFQNVTAKGEE